MALSRVARVSLALLAVVPLRAWAEPEIDPVEQHVLMRGQQILIQFRGAARAGPEMARTKKAARLRAAAAIAALDSGKPFDEVCAEFSDEDDRATRHGDLGLIVPGALVSEVDAALHGLLPGQHTSKAVATVFGYHILQRLPLIPTPEVRHILIAYVGAMRAPQGVKRTREEALAAANFIEGRLHAGESFEDAARAHSDDAETASKGGMLGPLLPGMVVPAFERAAAALKVGQISDPVETPSGFHIILRTH